MLDRPAPNRSRSMEAEIERLLVDRERTLVATLTGATRRPVFRAPFATYAPSRDEKAGLAIVERRLARLARATAGRIGPPRAATTTFDPDQVPPTRVETPREPRLSDPPADPRPEAVPLRRASRQQKVLVEAFGTLIAATLGDDGPIVGASRFSGQPAQAAAAIRAVAARRPAEVMTLAYAGCLAAPRRFDSRAGLDDLARALALAAPGRRATLAVLRAALQARRELRRGSADIADHAAALERLLGCLGLDAGRAPAPFRLADAFLIDEGVLTFRPGDEVVVIVGSLAPPALLRRLTRGARSVRVVRLVGSAATQQPAACFAELARPGQAVVEETSADHLPQYGRGERQLSELCTVLADKVAGTIDGLCRGDPRLATLAECLPALAIRFDDAFFTAAAPLWAATEAAFAPSVRHAILLTDDNEFGACFFAAALALERTADISFCGVSGNALDPSVVADDGFAQALAAARPPAGAERSARDDLAALYAEGCARAPEVSRQDVLFVGRPLDRNYKADVVALVRRLQDSRKVALMPGVLRLPPGTPVHRALSDAGIPSGTAVIAEPERAPREAYSAIAPRLREAVMGLVMRDLLAARDLPPLCDAILCAAQGALQRLMEQTLCGLVVAVAEIERVLGGMQPRQVIVAPGRDWIARVACVLARREGIPSFDLQTVFVGPRPRYRPTLADRQLALDTTARDIFERHFAMPREAVLLAGCVKLAALRRRALDADADAVRARLVPPGQQLIAFAASPILTDCMPVARALAAAVGATSTLRLAIKLHPSADEPQRLAYAALAEATGHQVAVCADIDLSDLIAASSIVVTRFSNVGLEAALAGRDVIACRFDVGGYAIPLDEMGVAALATSPAELSRILTELLADGPAKAALAASRSAYLEANPQLTAEDATGLIVAAIDAETERLAQPKRLVPA